MLTRFQTESYSNQMSRGLSNKCIFQMLHVNNHSEMDDFPHFKPFVKTVRWLCQKSVHWNSLASFVPHHFVYTNRSQRMVIILEWTCTTAISPISLCDLRILHEPSTDLTQFHSYKAPETTPFFLWGLCGSTNEIFSLFCPLFRLEPMLVDLIFQLDDAGRFV